MASRRKRPHNLLASDPLWYKDAIIYELHVRAFYDSNGDGIGDFAGLLEKLDYIQDLGVTAIWILPFYPSPLRDDGYDIADYTDVHPAYGTLADFKRFLNAAHDRGLRVITELAINHTSNEHPWFQRARRAPPGSRYRNYYVWSDTMDRYKDARIIFEDFETSNWTWDPVAGAFYWHRFYSHQPDLNFDNPEVQRAVLRVLDFWMELGVDGMRLDAIPYLFEREGTNCENLPETHAFLKRLRAHVDAHYADRMLLAEANQWPDDAAAYFGEGDECHMNFHFPVMPRLFMSLQLENRFPIADILEQTPQIPENCQWALFLRNHDELTLEMVTDEDRDYMYRTYAEDPRMRVNVGIRRRLAPLLGLRSKLELLNGLLMSLPGTPVIYYGDEIGQGDNVYLGDRNGVRTPMQWSSDRNAGFSRANPQRLYLPVIIDPEYHYEAINVEAQQGNPESLLWWTKRLIALRKQHPVFGRGSIEFLEPDNGKVLCFIRSHEGHDVLVVANLSRHAQYVELDLARYRTRVPVEMSGGTAFPAITEAPYLLTLGGYGFAWFELRDVAGAAMAHDATELRWAEARDYRELFAARMSRALEQAFAKYLQERRWFRAKARTIKVVRCVDRLPLEDGATPTSLLVLRVEYDSGLPEHYTLPVAFARAEAAAQFMDRHPGAGIARVRLGAQIDPERMLEGVLYDPTGSEELGLLLLKLFSRRRVLTGAGQLRFVASRNLRAWLAERREDLRPSFGSAEQSNTMVFYGHELALKLFRRIEPGINPDAEVSRFLTRHGYPNTAEVLATVEYDGPGLAGSTAGIVQRFVPNIGNAWEMTLEALVREFDNVLVLMHDGAMPEPPEGGAIAAHDQRIPETMFSMIGSYHESARLIGRRTAELHLALASDSDDPAFRPEPFAGHYLRSIVQAARDRVSRNLELLHRRRASLPEPAQALAAEVLALEKEFEQRLASLQRTRVDAVRIRVHGDYHLGQLLYDGRDFTIIDFEGEPAVSLGVRRLKLSALVDVAGMLRSFEYAAARALLDGRVRPEDRPRIQPWAEAWAKWVGATFLDAYLETAGDAPFIPKSEGALETLLTLHMIDKCAYELGYELNNRPEWVGVPLIGLRSLLR